MGNRWSFSASKEDPHDFDTEGRRSSKQETSWFSIVILGQFLFSVCSSFFPNNWVKYILLVASKWYKWRYQCPQNIFFKKTHNPKVEQIIIVHEKASNLIFKLKYHLAIALMIFFWRKNVELFCYKNCYITAKGRYTKTLLPRVDDVETSEHKRNKRIFHTMKEQKLFYTFAFFLLRTALQITLAHLPSACWKDAIHVYSFKWPFRLVTSSCHRCFKAAIT